MDPGVVDTMGRGEDMSPAYDCSATVGILVGLIPAGIDDHLDGVLCVIPTEIKHTQPDSTLQVTRLRGELKITLVTLKVYFKHIF
jgi:hypothetical protein